ncbi:MAG: gliding motility-associated C-terminal domain-containing protein [Candidatus Latescibacterota bacterium]
MRRARLLLLSGLLWAWAAGAQVRTFVLGEAPNAWETGGRGAEPLRLEGRYHLGRLVRDNAPGDAIEYHHRPGWIGPRYFDGTVNLAAMVLAYGKVRAPNVVDVGALWLRAQLEGMVNGDHDVAFERKPSLAHPQLAAYGIVLVLDFGQAIGAERIRFYPRNTVEPTPDFPYHNDFLRGYEVWVNPRQTNTAAGYPDILVARVPENSQAVVDVPIRPQYVRLVKIRSLADEPFEIDEVEVYGTGYLPQASYYSDLLDLGGRATVGPVHWVEGAAGDTLFSHLGVQVRTGNDDTPVRFALQFLVGEGMDAHFYVEEVTEAEYWEEDNKPNRVLLQEDEANWSSWRSLRNGQLCPAPGPRRFIQFSLAFQGRLFDTRQVDRLSFDYLTPPLADTLRAEVFPRLAQAEEPATFSYAVLLRAAGAIQGIDRLEVDTVIPATGMRGLRINGQAAELRVETLTEEAFRIAFPLVKRDSSVVEFTFDMPVFRFGTTFSGRAYNSRYPSVPQLLEPGQAASFGPGDEDVVSGLTVAIPRRQIGKLVGEIVPFPRLFTPNGDGVNDVFRVRFNLLQVVTRVPVRLEVYDLAGRRVHTILDGEQGIGPVECQWDGRLADGSRVLPGSYLWVLCVDADAFAERHQGVLAVAY